MNFQMQKNSLNISKCFCESKCEQAVSLEINLPDYCSDIKRILKCMVTPGVANISLSGEAVTLSGVIVTRLVYVGEDDKIDCYEHNSALSCSTQIKDLPEGASFKAFAKTDYINCRALSQRKISVNGSIGVNICVYRENKRELPEKAEGCGVEIRTEKLKMKNLICQSEKTFDMSETVALDQSRPDIAKIIRCVCYPVMTSQKAVSDKLLIKGELKCVILYCTEKDNRLQKLQHTMPVSQIMDLPGIDENSDISVSLYCRQSVTAVKNDSSGKGRLLEIAARVSAFVKCSKEKEISVIDDCYSTQYEVKGDYKLIEFPVSLVSEKKNITKEQSIEFSSERIREILDMWHSDVKGILSYKEGNIEGKCSFLLCGIYIDSDGNPRYGEKNTEMDIQLSPVGKHEDVRCMCEAEITSLEFTLLPDGKVKIKADMSLCCDIFSVKTKRVLTDLEINKDSKKKDDAPALTLYYADEGESVWEIARRYNTTPGMIKGENAIDGDCTRECGMLLIPCV